MASLASLFGKISKTPKAEENIPGTIISSAFGRYYVDISGNTVTAYSRIGDIETGKLVFVSRVDNKYYITGQRGYVGAEDPETDERQVFING